MKKLTDEVTIADFIPRDYLREPDVKMTWDEYLALPTGLFDAREKRATQYRFPGRARAIEQFAIPMIATYQSARDSGDGDGSQIETWKHQPVALADGIFAHQAVLLTETATGNVFKCMYGEVKFTA